MRILLLVALVPLAGCLGDEAPVADVPQEPQADGNVTVPAHFAGDMGVTVTQVNSPVARHSFGSNCLHSEATQYVHNMTVTATWDAATPATETLELRIVGDQMFVAQGTSPLTLEARDLVRHDFFQEILVMAQAPSPAGVSADQDVILSIDMTFDGPDDPAFGTGGCSFY